MHDFSEKCKGSAGTRSHPDSHVCGPVPKVIAEPLCQNHGSRHSRCRTPRNIHAPYTGPSVTRRCHFHMLAFRPSNSDLDIDEYARITLYPTDNPSRNAGSLKA